MYYKGCKIKNVDLTNTSFKYSKFENVKFVECILKETIFENVYGWENIEFIGSELL